MTAVKRPVSKRSAPKREPRKPPPFAIVLDNNGLIESYRNAVAAALPMGVEPDAFFWRDLESAVGFYISMRQHRLHRPPIRERERWKRIAALVDELGAELRKVRKETPWSQSDLLWPNRALAALCPVKRYAEAAVIGYGMLAAAALGRRDPPRWYLYHAILDLWRDHLKQPLRYSVSAGGKRGGPLVRFVVACVGPLVDKPPTVRTITSIVDERRKGRRRR